jgi:IS5 family transposase
MQLSFGDAEGLAQRKQTRRELLLNEMDQVVPWKGLLALIERHYPVAGRPGRHPYPLATMLRVHLLQQWYALSDPSMEEALYDTAVMRRIAGISGVDRIPDETTILNFRRLLETHELGGKMLEAVNSHLQRKGLSLRSGTIVDATIIHAPSSTKNANKARDPEMHQTRKGNQWHLRMEAHIGVDEFSGLVHHVKCTAANAGDVTVTHELLHGKEDCVLGDSGYTGADKRAGLEGCKATFFIAEKHSKVQAIKNKRDRRQYERWESCKASMRAKV